MEKSINTQIWRLAWPMILSNLTIPLLGLVDTAILGHLPEAHYLGAAAVGGIIFNMLFWTFGFLRMGTTGLGAQAAGAGNNETLQLLLWQSLTLAAVLGLLLLALQRPLFDLAFLYMAPGPEVETHARIYCDIRIFAAPASLANYVIFGWLLSLGKARQVMLLAITANLVNIALDYWLVVHGGMLTDGVALGSLAAEYTTLGLGLYIALKLAGEMPGRAPLGRLFNTSAYLHLLRVNRYIFVRTICLLFAFSFFYAMSAQQEDVVLSANAILITLLLLFAYGQDGFANAAEVLTGRAIGAQRLDEFYAVSKSSAVCFGISSVLFVLVMALADQLIIGLLTDLPDVKQVALQYWHWLLIVPLLATWNFLLDGIFIGATKARAMQNTMLFSSLLVFLPAWYLLQHLGNQGLWIAFACFHGARSVSMAVVYYYYTNSSRWLLSPSTGSQCD